MKWLGREGGGYKGDLKGESREMRGYNQHKQGKRMFHEGGNSQLLGAVERSRV